MFQSVGGNKDYTNVQHFYYSDKIYVIQLTVAKMDFYKIPVYVVVVRKI